MLSRVRSAGFVVGALTLLALGLRLIRLNTYSVWYDEAIYLLIARNAFASGMTLNTILGGLPATLLLGAWSMLGSSDWWLRLLSVLTGVAAVPAIYRMARRMVDRWVATLCAAALALNPLHLYYAQTIRKESLFVLCSILTLSYFFGALAQGRSRDLYGYALFGLLILSLSPLSAPLLAVAAVYTLVGARRLKIPLKRWLAAHAILGLATLGWIAAMTIYYADEREAFAPSLNLREVLRIVKTGFFGHHLPESLLVPAAALAIGVCLYGFYWQWRADRVLFRFMALASVGAVATLAGAAGLGLELLLARYFAYLLPLAVLQLAYGLRYLRPAYVSVPVAGALVAFGGMSAMDLYGNEPIHEIEAPQRKDYRSMARFIMDHQEEAKVAVHFHRSSFICLERYTEGEIENRHLLFDLPECAVTNLDNRYIGPRLAPVGLGDSQAREELAKHSRVWLVFSEWQQDKLLYHPGHHLWRDTPSDAVLNWMRRNHRQRRFKDDDGRMVWHKTFGGMPWVRIYLFDLSEEKDETVHH